MLIASSSDSSSRPHFDYVSGIGQRLCLPLGGALLEIRPEDVGQLVLTL
jgi:hypothetical protein